MKQAIGYRFKAGALLLTVFLHFYSIGSFSLDPGCIITANQTVLFGNLPTTIDATPASAGSCNGSYIYQWQSSTDNIYFTDIPGATSEDLSFSSTLSQTTYFQRKTTCGTEVKWTSWVRVSMASSITYYNVEKSGSFTRNNCPSGYVGSTVTYTVPANTYSSTVSQADADSQAQNDVDSNGQDYANANGTCTDPCNGSCTAEGEKCINGSCEIGIKVYTDSYYDEFSGWWICTYHYEWSDDSWSQDYTEYSSGPCAM